jgi:hypothetical protein
MSRNFPAMKRLISATLAASTLFSMAATAPLSAQSSALPGVAVLERMRKAYDGKWYKTLTFVQRTIIERPGAKADTTTWYETLLGARLRIDVGFPSAGMGMLYTADSTYVMRQGILARATPTGNPFLPLIMGVYLQPVAQTARELGAFGIDVSKATVGSWEGRRVDIVGASSTADTTSAQFWVDDLNLVVRVLGTLRGMGNADVRIGGYERLGPAWLGTKVSIIQSGRTQVEEYTDWKANPAVSPELFDLTKWTTAPHWAPKKPQ